jgi:hypothetical protein
MHRIADEIPYRIRFGQRNAFDGFRVCGLCCGACGGHVAIS